MEKLLSGEFFNSILKFLIFKGVEGPGGSGLKLLSRGVLLYICCRHVEVPGCAPLHLLQTCGKLQFG